MKKLLIVSFGIHFLLMSAISFGMFNEHEEIERAIQVSLNEAESQNDHDEEQEKLEDEPAHYENNYWDCLPSELKIHIMSHLRAGDFKNVLLVSQDFQDHVLDPLCLRNWITYLVKNNRKDQYLPTFFSCIKQGKKELVELFLQLDPTLVGQQLKRKSSFALSVAVEKGQREIVELLLEKKAPIDQRSSVSPHFYETPLTTAIRKGYILIAKLLIDHGAEIDAADDRYSSPIETAVVNRNIELIKLLLKKGANPQEGFNLSARGFKNPLMVPIMKIFLDAGANLSRHFYLLEWAVFENNVKMIEFLLKYADKEFLNWPNSAGNTVLFEAVKLGHKEAVQVLLDAGADSTLENMIGIPEQTSLDIARMQQNQDILNLLLEKATN